MAKRRKRVKVRKIVSPSTLIISTATSVSSSNNSNETFLKNTVLSKSGDLISAGISYAKAQKNVIILSSLWIAFCAVVITFPNFHWFLPGWLFSGLAALVPFNPSWITALYLLGAMFVFIRFFIPSDRLGTNKDFPIFWLKIFLFIALLGRTLLCLYHMDKPMGMYTETTGHFVQQIRNLKDTSNFGDGNYGQWFIFDYGLLASWPFAAVSLWHLLPFSTGLEIQRITNTFFDLGTILLIYLAGKEIGGRRVGLLAAILVSVSQPLLNKVVSGYPSETLAFGIAIALWLTIRLERKNSILDFLLWGAGIAFLACTAAPFEPFIPFFIFMGLGSIWWNNRKTMQLKDTPFWIWLSLTIFLIYYACCNNAFSNNLVILQQIQNYRIIVLCAVLAACRFLLSPKNLIGEKGLFVKWFLGSWLTTILSYLVIANPMMVGRIQEHSSAGAGFLKPDYLLICFHRLSAAIETLFLDGGDISDMAIYGDNVFSYWETILIALGLCFCIAKPNFRRVVLILTAMLGILPFMMVDARHSGLLIGSIVPFLLIGAIGLNDFLEVIRSGLSRTRFSDSLICVFLIVLWGLASLGVFSRVHTQWAEKRLDAAEYAAQDAAKGYRTYLALSFPPYYYEGRFPLYLFHEVNPIDLSPNEKVPDLVIYINRADITDEIHKFFPNSKWTGLYSPYDAGQPALWRCEISSDELLKSQQNLFTISRMPGYFWERSYMPDYQYLNLSLVNWEDGVVDVDKPLPPPLTNSVIRTGTIKLEGVIHVNHGGKYEIICSTGNRSKVWIDGEKIFDLVFPIWGTYVTPPRDAKVSLNLAEGDHKVEVVSYFQHGNSPPDITLRALSPAGQAQSLWKSFSFN